MGINFILRSYPTIGLALHTTSLIEPRVMATYRFCALILSVFSNTATSASSPLSSSVLPTARLGNGRPSSRFSSRTRLAASARGTVPDEASRSALSARWRMAGRCTRTFGIARNSDNSAAAATREGARLNSKARLSASVGGFLAVPLTQSLYKCRPSLIVAQRLLALSCYCEFAPRGRKRLRRAVQPDLTTAADHLYLGELLLPPG